MDKNVPVERTRLSMLPARLRGRAATHAAGDTGLMFFLLRMAFWLGVVLVLLPSGLAQHATQSSDVGASDAVPADAGVLVLSRGSDVRTALEGLDGDAYDLIMRPAAASNGAVADPASLWRAGDMRLLPAVSPPPASVLSPANAVVLAALRDMLRARDPGTGAHSERVRIYALALAEAHGVPKSQLLDI